MEAFALGVCRVLLPLFGNRGPVVVIDRNVHLGRHKNTAEFIEEAPRNPFLGGIV